jgi:hypothetical protein
VRTIIISAAAHFGSSHYNHPFSHMCMEQVFNIAIIYVLDNDIVFLLTGSSGAIIFLQQNI